MRLWSWKYSRWRRCHTPVQTWALSCGAQCADRSIAARVAQRGDPQEPGDPAAAGDVGLQAVHRPGVEHALEVGQVPAVLAGGDVDAARGAVADQAQPGAGRPRSPAPRTSARRTRRRSPPSAGAWARVKAPLASTNSSTSSPIASRATAKRSRSRSGSRPVFIFTRGMPASTQPGELVAQLLVGVVAEPAAAVDRRGVVHRVERVDERDVQQPGLEIPQRDVHRRDRHRDQAGLAEVADRVPHRRPRRADAQRVRAARRRRRACRETTSAAAWWV